MSRIKFDKINRGVYNSRQSMRIDKFLKVSRILKRRTAANDACTVGRVSVNGKQVKPAYAVKIGDEVAVELGSRVIRFRVLAINEKATKEGASNLYEIIGDL